MLDERLVGRPGVFAYDPLRLAVDIRGVAATGYELAPLLRELDDINLELYGQNVLVAVFGMAERSLAEAGRLVAALRRAVERVGVEPSGLQSSFAAAPPWGELAMTPRSAYLGPQEVVPAERPSAGSRPSRWPRIRRGSPTCSRGSGSRPRPSPSCAARWSRAAASGEPATASCTRSAWSWSDYTRPAQRPTGGLMRAVVIHETGMSGC